MSCQCPCHHDDVLVMCDGCCEGVSDLTGREEDALRAYLVSHRQDIELGINDFSMLAPLLVWLDRT